jgi:hypothetical protein
MLYSIISQGCEGEPFAVPAEVPAPDVRLTLLSWQSSKRNFKARPIICTFSLRTKTRKDIDLAHVSFECESAGLLAGAVCLPYRNAVAALELISLLAGFRGRS